MKPTDGRENAPEQCCLPAQGRRVAHGAARGRMTHCSENSLFQTSGQAAAQGGPGWDPRSSTWSVGSPPPDLPAAGMPSGGLWGPLFLPGSTNLLGNKEAGRASTLPPLPHGQKALAEEENPVLIRPAAPWTHWSFRNTAARNTAVEVPLQAVCLSGGGSPDLHTCPEGAPGQGSR